MVWTSPSLESKLLESMPIHQQYEKGDERLTRLVKKDEFVCWKRERCGWRSKSKRKRSERRGFLPKSSMLPQNVIALFAASSAG